MAIKRVGTLSEKPGKLDVILVRSPVVLKRSSLDMRRYNILEEKFSQ
jgi:hypothetical protein